MWLLQEAAEYRRAGLGGGGGRGRVRTEVDQRYGLRSASEYCVWQAKELGFFFFFSKPAKHGDGVVRLLID